MIVTPAQVVVPVQTIPWDRAETTTIQPTGEMSRQELVRELQREMVRTGCHSAQPDGEWGPDSRRSMRVFLERANSRLSADEPDMLQLTLLRGHVGRVCRSATGGMMTAGGGELHVTSQPYAMRTAVPPAPHQLAAGPLAPEPAQQAWTGPVEAPREDVILEGRMAVGGPSQDGSHPTAAHAAYAGGLDARPAPHRTAAKPQSRALPARDKAWTGTFFER
jgi:hypothetical protein